MAKRSVAGDSGNVIHIFRPGGPLALKNTSTLMPPARTKGR